MARIRSGHERRRRLLTFDGGGVRGLYSARILREIETALDAPVAKHVDLVAGTSVGALLACGVAAGLDADSLIERIWRFAPAVFPSSHFYRAQARARSLFGAKHEARRLHDALRSVFGRLRFGELPIPTVVTTYDRVRGEPLPLYSTFDGAADLPVWEVCAASASAPTYFPDHHTQIGPRAVSLIDGGVCANNPAAYAVAWALAQGSDPRETWVVSIGTGKAPPIPVDPADSLGLAEWAPYIPETLIDAAAGAMHDVALAMLPPGHLIRLQQPMCAHVRGEMDDASKRHLDALFDAGRGAAEAMRGKVRMAAEVLR